EDFTGYSITAPSDSRLPGGGNYAVGGLFNVVPGKFGQTSNNITLASDFGEQYQRYNGMLLNVSARLGTGLTFQGGVNTGNTVPINLVAPGQVWGDRVNALDLRFAKILRFGRTRSTIGIDVYNVANSAAILTYNQSFNPAATTGSQAWLAPLSVLTPRFMKIGAQIDF